MFVVRFLRRMWRPAVDPAIIAALLGRIEGDLSEIRREMHYVLRRETRRADPTASETG